MTFSYLQFQSLQVIPPATDLKAVRLEDIGQYGRGRDVFYNFDSMPAFTVEFKMRASELNNGNMPALVTNKDWNSGGNPGWVIYANRNVLGVNMGDGKGNRIDFENSTTPAVDDNRWHHIYLTVDRKGDAKLYQDSLLYNSTSIIRIKTLMNNAAPNWSLMMTSPVPLAVATEMLSSISETCASGVPNWMIRRFCSMPPAATPRSAR